MGRKKLEKPTVLLDLTKYTRSGKLRKRKPKIKRDYFTPETDIAILKYRDMPEGREKHDLFAHEISYAIHKLAENIISNFNFTYLKIQNKKDLQHEMVIFAMERFSLFDTTKGAGYGYFGTCIKRRLITMNQEAEKVKDSKSSLPEIDEEKNTNFTVNLSDNMDDLYHFFEAYVDHLEKKKHHYFVFDNDLLAVNAFISIMKYREDFELLNKKSLFFMIKEQTKLSTVQISRVAKLLKIIYKRCLTEWCRTGYLSTQDLPNWYVSKEDLHRSILDQTDIYI